MAKLAVLLVAVAALGVSATAATAAPKAQKLTTITLGVPGIPPVFLGVMPYTALEQGYYKHFGLDVQIKGFTSGTDAVKAVQAGQIDLAWSPTPFAMTLISKGTPLVGIEGMDKVDWLIGSNSSSVQNCSDLKGQSIGVDSIGGARYQALQAMLTKCKLDIKDVKTVNFPGAAAMQAMIAGSLKVSVLHIDEQAQIEQVGKKKVYINARLTDVDPYQHYDILVSTRDGVKAHYYDYVKLLAGDVAATRWMYNKKNLDEAARIAEVTGDTDDVSKQALQAYIKMKWWPLDKSGLGIARITRTIGLNVKLGNISPAANLKWKDVVDTRMWKAGFKLANGRKR